jgi:hypothetical protein
VKFLKVIRETKGIGTARAASVARSLSGQMEFLYKPRTVNPPVGFSIRSGFYLDMPGPSHGLLVPATGLQLNLSYLVRDRQTGAIKTASSESAAIVIKCNGLEEYYSQEGQFWQDCDKFHLPLFFEKPAIIDSTADYIETGFEIPGDTYDVRNSPVRIIRRNNRPLFIPLTRTEFLKFLTARTGDLIKTSQESVKELTEGLVTQKKMRTSARVKPADTAYISESIRSTESNIARFEDNIKKAQEQVKKYHNLLASMSPGEAASPVRLDEQKKIQGFDLLDRLVPVGRHEGVSLCRLNPDYYDHSPSAPVVQTAIVYYVNDYAGMAVPTFIGKKAVDIFNELDFHQLKENMK